MSRREKPISGQYIINAVHRQMDAVTKCQPGVSIRMRWIPGHEGVEGNERADEEAKKAAAGETSEEAMIPIECRGILPISKSVEIQRFQAELKVKERLLFMRSPRAKFAHEYDPSMPSPAFSKLSSRLAQRHASLLIQLRTGHIQLNKHLYKIGKVDSPTCAVCRVANETVHHYLFRCPGYKEQRERL